MMNFDTFWVKNALNPRKTSSKTFHFFSFYFAIFGCILFHQKVFKTWGVQKPTPICQKNYGFGQLAVGHWPFLPSHSSTILLKHLKK